MQLALQKQDCPGCDPGAADGVAGLATHKAVLAYRKFINRQQPNSLPENGNPKDPATKLGVIAKAKPGAGAPRTNTSA